MIDEKKIELIKKLQRLAERGVGGEKEGAQKKLQQLMKKYDIEESDLSDDKLGNSSHHRPDGRMEAAVCDLGKCKERKKQTHDCKLRQVSERT
jgi:hypothetical protein